MSQRNTKKTTEEFKQEVFERVGCEYSVLGEYLTKDTKLLMKHNTCNTEYMVTPHSFLNGNRCPECGMKNRHLSNTKKFGHYLTKLKEKGILDQIEFIDIIKEDDRINSKKKLLTFKVKKNNLVHKSTISNLLKLESDDISKSNFILQDDSFKTRLLERNPNLEILSEYKGNKEKIKVRCKICGTEINRSANNLMTNSSCPTCNKNSRKLSYEELISRFSKYRVDVDEYEIDTSNYKNNRTKLKFKHKKCGTEFNLNSHAFISKKHSCPFCRCSYYEKVIEVWLRKNEIKYEREKRFDMCKNITTLPFDFYIDDSILLEYDGQHHFYPVRNEERYDDTIRNDTIKNNFCKENNIPLIRIPFWLYNEIDNILNMIKNKKSISEICDYIELQGSTTIPEKVVEFHNRSRAQNIE